MVFQSPLVLMRILSSSATFGRNCKNDLNSTYHSQSDGQMEVANRTLESMFSRRETNTWDDELPQV